MKKKTIAASILSIALCGSLATGATFALFTSEDNVNIAINAGKVALTAEITNLELYSPTGIAPDGKIVDKTNAADNTNGVFVNGGTAGIVENKLTLSNMTPGDKASFDIVLTNASNVNIVYQTIISSVNDTGLFDGLKITYEGSELQAYAGFNMMSDWKNIAANAQPSEEDATISVSVELPADAGNEYQTTATEIAFSVTAYQGNAVVENPTVSANVADALKADGDIEINLGAPVTTIDISDKSAWGGASTETITINGNGNTLVLNNDYGTSYKNAVVGAINPDAKIILNNVNIKAVKNVGGTWDSHDIRFDNATEMTDVNFEQEIALNTPGKTMKLTNVNIVPTTNKADNDLYAMWIKAGTNVELTNVEINSQKGRAIKVDDQYVETNTQTSELKIDGLTVSSAKKAAIIVKSHSEVVINAKNVDISKVKADKVFAVWADEDNYFVDDTNVTVNGVKMRNERDIATAEALVAFANSVNKGNTYAKAPVVKIVDNIDMAGVEYTPAGNVNGYPSYTFAGTFDGGNFVISNLVANAEGDGGFASAGLFGSITGVVKNVILDNATITSTHYAGGIVGFSSANVGMAIKNCQVLNSNITSTPELLADGTYDNGDKVGGIIGYCVAGDVVEGNSVENTTVTGYRDIGGIVGHAAGTIKDNKAVNVTTSINKTYNYKGYTTDAEHDCNPIIGENAGATVSGNKVNGAIHEEIVQPGTVEELKKAFEEASNGANGNIVINLAQDFDVAGNWEVFSPKNYSGVHDVTINGNGYTIYNLNKPLMMGSFAGEGTVTINNLTIANAEIKESKYNNLGLGAFIAYSDASGGVVLNGCKLIDSTVECTDGYAGGLVGYSSTPVTIKNCEVSNSTITGGNSSGAICGQFAASATVSECKVTNCTVEYAYGDEVNTNGWRVGIVVGTANVGTVTLTKITESGNTLTQGTVSAPEHSNLYGRSLGNGITLDGTTI